MLFANNILLGDKTRKRIASKVERKIEVLKSKGIIISRIKTKYMQYNFIGIIGRNRCL